MDASSSAYQFMSYMLFDEDLAKATNLLKLDDSLTKNDLYLLIQGELCDIIKQKYGNSAVSEAICQNFSRKLIKSIYMPLVYGKSKHAAAQDISKSGISLVATSRDAYLIANMCYEYGLLTYPTINKLMRLVNEIGWFAGY